MTADKSRRLQELETDLQKTTVVFIGLLSAKYNDISRHDIVSGDLLRVREKEKSIPRGLILVNDQIDTQFFF
jgi:hypothetical protein